jgi:hypothetical protein
LRVRIPPMPWVSVSCECCVLPGRGHCGWPIPLVCVCVCVSLIVTKCSNSPYTYNELVERCQNKKERKQESLELLNIC